MAKINHIENNSTMGTEAAQPTPIYQKTKSDSSLHIGLIRKKKVRAAIARKAFIANTCLLAWVILLAVIGMQAVSGKASTVILEIADAFVPSKKPQDDKKESPRQGTTKISPSLDTAALLSDYIKGEYSGQDKTSIPPISIVLDRLQVNVSWRDAKEIDNANGNNRDAPSDIDYENLFAIVAKRLEAIADFSPEVSVSSNLKISNNIMPLIFRATKDGSSKEEFKEQEIDLPVEAVLWVKARQSFNTAKESRISFLDLFVLLTILGGFGSWVYLVRRHVDPKITPDLYEYFYRPPLGMTLAIAVFIINISLHSLVSNSNINEVRKETLILLAFTAGLLSDKTYEFIEKVTGEKLRDREPEDASKIEDK
jgi:hypothetical protein